MPTQALQQIQYDIANKILQVVPLDIVDRNIVPYAQLQFESLIEDFGNTRGPKIIKDLLSAQMPELNDDEKNAVDDFKKVIFVPHISLFQHPHHFRNSIARGIFALSICNQLQDHYLTLQNTASNEVLSELRWIPSWTKCYTRQVSDALNVESVKRQTQQRHTRKDNLIFLPAGLFFLFAVYLLFNDQKKEAHKLFVASFLFLSMRFFTFIADRYIGDPLTMFFANKLNKETFGSAYDVFSRCRTSILNKEFPNEVSLNSKEEEDLLALTNLLYARMPYM